MKFRKRKNREIELGGQDSFLDLVSNIVGILIILVMIAGIRAQYSSADPRPADVPAAEQTLAEIDSEFKNMQAKEATAQALKENVLKTKTLAKRAENQMAEQTDEYAVLFDLMTSMQSELEFMAEEKSQKDKEKIEYQRQLLETNAKLKQIQQAKNYFDQTRSQTKVLENIPTPLSQTVNNREIHVRLLGGKIVYIPFMELMNQLQRHIGENRNLYFQKKSVMNKVGPVENFELAFVLQTHEVSMDGNIGTRLAMQYAEFLPNQEPIGEPLRHALDSPESEFRKKLAAYRKDLYTVTVWVYPDSFEEYQELKKFLSVRGYALAARPLAMGHPIAASPLGTKSSSQ